MRPDPVEITLAGESYVIRPLTLRQVQEIELLTSKPAESQVGRIAGILDIVLKRDHSDGLPEGGVLDLEVSRDELAKAAAAVRTLSAPEGIPAGEAEAAKPAAAPPGDIATAA